MKPFILIATALLTSTPIDSARPTHFDVYVPLNDNERLSRDWFVRTEPGGIVVYRSDAFPDDRDRSGKLFFVNKVNCRTMSWMVHQRWENGMLDWTKLDHVRDGNWQAVPLSNAEHFKWACSWAK